MNRCSFIATLFIIDFLPHLIGQEPRALRVHRQLPKRLSDLRRSKAPRCLFTREQKPHLCSRLPGH